VLSACLSVCLSVCQATSDGQGNRWHHALRNTRCTCQTGARIAEWIQFIVMCLQVTLGQRLPPRCRWLTTATWRTIASLTKYVQQLQSPSLPPAREIVPTIFAIFPLDHELWPGHPIRLGSVKMNHYCSDTRTVTQRTDCSTWTTKVISNNLINFERKEAMIC